MINKKNILFPCILVTVLLSACDLPKPLGDLIGSVKMLMGISEPFTPKSASSPTPSPGTNAAANAVKVNAELLTEILQVVFNTKEITDQSNFVSLVSSLDQGASLEGIYRGLVMGARYRGLESNARAASPESIKFFAGEMGELQMGMKEPSAFSKDTAKLVPTIEYPSGTDDSGPDSYTFGDAPVKKEEQTVKTPKVIADEMMADFIGATPYTLKRVLSDEALKKIDELKDSPPELAQWYAKFVVRMCGMGIDFGLPQRNENDFDFHFRFAKTVSNDRLKWEVLNRYHRVINHLQEQ